MGVEAAVFLIVVVLVWLGVKYNKKHRKSK